MRRSLESLGYTEQDIDKMTPGEASNKVNCRIQNYTTASISESGVKQVERKD